MIKLNCIQKICVYILLIGGAFVFIIPFLWMISTALKPLDETMSLPPIWIPSEFQWHNFKDAIAEMGHFWTYLKNSVLICLLDVTGTVLSSALVAYGFSRLNWPGRDRLFMLVLATMMIPFPVIMVPIYDLFKTLGWVGTFKPLWVPSWFAAAFNVFLLRQFFLTLPKDISESARIDGCNEFQIFWKIILPLSIPALLVVAILQFLASWNDFMAPMIYLTDQEQFTLPLGLQSFQSKHGGTAWNHLMAASTLILLPVVILFFFTQKYFVEGIATTGGKN